MLISNSQIPSADKIFFYRHSRIEIDRLFILILIFALMFLNLRFLFVFLSSVRRIRIYFSEHTRLQKKYLCEIRKNTPSASYENHILDEIRSWPCPIKSNCGWLDSNQSHEVPTKLVYCVWKKRIAFFCIV